MSQINQINQKYYELLIQYPENFSTSDKDQIDDLMMSFWGCDGMQDYVLDEKELEQILGTKTVTGGPLSADILQTVEQYAELKNNQKVIYFFSGVDGEQKASSAVQQLQKLFPHIAQIELSAKIADDWMEKWKEHYHPISIDAELKVFPSWYTLDKIDVPHFIRIDPGQAFGTGSHESTKLCLKIFKKNIALFNTLAPNFHTLDFGCGSGILGIAVNHFFPKTQTLFYDLDPAALENVMVNLELNHQKFAANNLFSGEHFPVNSYPQKFSLLFANILLPILLEKSETLTQLLAPLGYLIISGIMDDQWDELYAELQKHATWKIIEILEDNHWLSVLIQKK